MSVIALYFVLVFLVALLAANRGRSAWRWFLISLFITPVIGGLVVMALPKTRRVYVGSEWDVEPPAPGVVPMPADAVLRIVRPRGYSDRQRLYDILVNGAEVGVVEPDSTIDFAVPSGRLTVEAYADWARSAPLVVETRPGRTVEIEVSNAWGPVLGFWVMLLQPGSYLRLRQVEPAPAGHPSLDYGSGRPSAVRP
jgi:hypothetical protein